MLSAGERRKRLLEASPDSRLARSCPALLKTGLGIIHNHWNRIAALSESRGNPEGEGRPHVRITPLLKPAGDDCNLKCRYCQTRADPPEGRRMGRDLLDSIVRQVLSLSAARTDFIFHGGEPLLAGLEFFSQAVELEKRHAREGQVVRNHVQTNGTLITPEWARFFARNGFFVGISLDGPALAHDAHRVGPGQGGTHARIMESIRMLQSEGVRLQAIAVVPPRPVVPPEDLLAFMQETGIAKWRVNFCRSTDSIATYPDYMDALFREWMALPDAVEIGILAESIEGLLGYSPRSCWMNGSCPRFIGFEPDGTVSPFCEMPVEAQYAYGNLHDQDLLDLMTGENARRFTAFLQQGREPCGTCRWTGLCSGGCAFSRLQLAGNPESADPLCPLYKGVFARLEAGLDEALEPDLRLHSA